MLYAVRLTVSVPRYARSSALLYKGVQTQISTFKNKRNRLPVQPGRLLRSVSFLLSVAIWVLPPLRWRRELPELPKLPGHLAGAPGTGRALIQVAHHTVRHRRIPWLRLPSTATFFWDARIHIFHLLLQARVPNIPRLSSPVVRTEFHKSPPTATT